MSPLNRINTALTRSLLAFFAAACSVSGATPVDWLLDPSPYKAKVTVAPDKKTLELDNGLILRRFQLAPNAATVELMNPGTGKSVLRAIKPEASITLDGTTYPVGGLIGQPCKNYFTAESLARMESAPGAYRFVRWEERPVEKRFDWEKHPEWISQDVAWPPPGKHIVMFYDPPKTPPKARVDLPAVEVHYEIFDGIPAISKWIVLRNTTKKSIRLDRFSAELLATVETAPKIEEGWTRSIRNSGLVPPDQSLLRHPPYLKNQVEAPRDYLDRFMDLFVVTDYAFGGEMEAMKDNPAVHWKHDPEYEKTGIRYYGLYQPAMLECAPLFGPALDLAPGEVWESFRVFEMLRDSTDWERRSLAECRFWRTFAPWTRENPIYMHITFGDHERIKKAIDQCAEVGFEMMVMSFGSGYNPLSTDKAYLAKMKDLIAYAKSKGIVLGGYSLLASRGGKDEDICISKHTGKRVRGRSDGSHFGASPCLCSKWGLNYFQQLRSFHMGTGAGAFEHDGSYPGDTCASTQHPGHRDFYDSQWRQWLQIRDFYRWCRGQGIYLLVPDWHFLNGSNKEPMGYVETNWSLPRAYQQIITRQNIYDGTFRKCPTMGFMFVPLTQYHGGGAAATVEPLHEHLDHYEIQLANLFGGGVQACYRGPRLYDTEETKELVKKWVGFYKRNRAILDSDLVHLRRANGRDWDGWLHVNPTLKTCGLAMLYNPLDEDIERSITLPLYYTGLEGKARLRITSDFHAGAKGKTIEVPLDGCRNASIRVTIPAKGRTAVFVEGNRSQRD